MTVLVGLGNPGKEYEDTRHNVGYRVAEEVLSRRGSPYESTRARARVARILIEEHPLLVARPLTYMNRSGPAVVALLDLAEAGPENLLVVCDDLYLDFGTIRLRPRGRDGGHNGLASIIEALGTQEFARLRVGIGPSDPGVAQADFVLAPFRRRERGALEDLVRHAADCAEAAVCRGIGSAMNRFNGASRADATEDQA